MSHPRRPGRSRAWSIVIAILVLMTGLFLVASNVSAASPRIISTTTGITSVATVSHSVTLPGTGIVSPGDAWFACIDTNGNTTVTIPTGWTMISQGIQSLTFT